MKKITLPSEYSLFDIFERQELATIQDINEEYWQLLESYSEIYKSAEKLFKSYKIILNQELFGKFRSRIRQARNYWESAKITNSESSPMLYYYSFMNLIKAYLLLHNIEGELVHGLKVSKQKTSYELNNVNISVRNGSINIFSNYYETYYLENPYKSYNLAYLLSLCSDISFQTVRAGFDIKTIVGKIRIGVDNEKRMTAILILEKNKYSIDYKSYLSPINEIFEVCEPPANGPFVKDFVGLNEPILINRFTFYELKDNNKLTGNKDIALFQMRNFLIQKLGNLIDPISNDHNGFSFRINFPDHKGRTKKILHEQAIYIIMFYLSDLVRYRPDVLYSLLETESSPVLRGFLTTCPSRFIRNFVSRILQPEIGYYLSMKNIG